MYLLKQYYTMKINLLLKGRMEEGRRNENKMIMHEHIHSEKIFHSSIVRASKATTSRNQLLRFAAARPRKKDQKHKPVWNTDGHLPPARISALRGSTGVLGKIFGNFRGNVRFGSGCFQRRRIGFLLSSPL